MIGLFALAALLQTAPADIDNEIVVVGRKLAAISVTVAKDARGRLSCSLSETSGNGRIDAQLCRTATQCVRKGTSDVKACVDRRKPALLEDFRRSLKGSAGR